ncbi:hypothetical protein GUITHDRAFT_131564 [Guillardia theta CCMP2712]|uniref:Wbp11/ELF5/Saf1 N-terminal domain-containing protein n=1 Tax=Guillardia theta (strain CCMP2712) TaxID=905079 RepID=L1K4S5_GUITC|nr:hypothetical protein GUITHDRAFT_131564 [Guillardia theta CCMP2712]EKX55343.1 hypothetical protein GUITHDRAFT_131564 [Guillardia theta CCMP2712]|eukprot:XP_005842323.1 hypothetical protein GUITHDRAFT_131564 [Guillardia theta CCMP2712]
MGKDKKAMNPNDAYRKQMKKKEIKRNKVHKQERKELEQIKHNPELARKRIAEIEDRERKHGSTNYSNRRKEELELVYNALQKKKKREEEEQQRQAKLAAAKALAQQPQDPFAPIDDEAASSSMQPSFQASSLQSSFPSFQQPLPYPPPLPPPNTIPIGGIPPPPPPVLPLGSVPPPPPPRVLPPGQIPPPPPPRNVTAPDKPRTLQAVPPPPPPKPIKTTEQSMPPPPPPDKPKKNEPAVAALASALGDYGEDSDEEEQTAEGGSRTEAVSSVVHAPISFIPRKEEAPPSQPVPAEEAALNVAVLGMAPAAVKRRQPPSAREMIAKKRAQPFVTASQPTKAAAGGGGGGGGGRDHKGEADALDAFLGEMEELGAFADI